MADNQETYTIRLADLNVHNGLVQIQNDADEAGQRISGIGGALGSLKGIIAGISIAHIGNEVVQTLAKFEKFEAVLTTTLGDNSAAQQAMQQITDFASATPFEVDGLTDSFVRLANQGFVPTMAEMTKLGDLASSKGKDMNQLSEALIDAQVGEFERLKEFGIRASKAGDQVSFTFKGQTQTMKMTDEAVKDYILSLGDLQGVQGSMAGISETTGGKLSNLSDTVTALYLNIGTKLKPVISGSINAMSEAVGILSQFTDWLASGSTGAKAFAVGVGVLVGGFLAYKIMMTALAIQTQIMTAYQWALNVAMTANPVGLVVVAIGALIAGIIIAYQTFDTFRASLNGVWAVAKQVGENLMGLFTKIPDMIIKSFTQIPTAIKNVFSGVGELFSAIFSGDFGKIPDILKGIGGNLLDANPVTGLAKQVFQEVTKGTGDAFNEAYDETMTQAEKDKKKSEKGKKAGSKLIPAGAGTGKDKGLGAGIAEVRSTAPKNFYINIGKLVESLNINTTNMQEGSAKVKEEITKLLLTAVNDMQIISE